MYKWIIRASWFNVGISSWWESFEINNGTNWNRQVSFVSPRSLSVNVQSMLWQIELIFIWYRCSCVIRRMARTKSRVIFCVWELSISVPIEAKVFDDCLYLSRKRMRNRMNGNKFVLLALSSLLFSLLSLFASSFLFLFFSSLVYAHSHSSLLSSLRISSVFFLWFWFKSIDIEDKEAMA